MSAKHTPGPWIVNELTRRGGSGLYRWHISTEEGRDAEVIATVPAPGVDTSHDLSDPVAEANAYLIAAAPDLLAALQVLVNLASHPLIDVSGLPAYAERLEDARAAIAKAVQS